MGCLRTMWCRSSDSEKHWTRLFSGMHFYLWNTGRLVQQQECYVLFDNWCANAASLLRPMSLSQTLLKYLPCHLAGASGYVRSYKDDFSLTGWIQTAMIIKYDTCGMGKTIVCMCASCCYCFVFIFIVHSWVYRSAYCASSSLHSCTSKNVSYLSLSLPLWI